MKVGFIGAGKVGTSMGLFLTKKNVQIVGYISRTLESSKRAARLTNSMPYEDMKQLIHDSNILFITTTDDAIEQVAKQIEALNVSLNNKIICHMSGAKSSDSISNLMKHSATIASIHPMYSFGNINNAVNDLDQVIFTVEGEGNNISQIYDLLDECRVKFIKIDTEAKTLYHAGACVVSNYLVTLIQTGINMFQEAGFSTDEIKQIIRPIVDNTINNVFDMGEKALTGPISRGDITTVESHLDILKESKSSFENIYKVLGGHTVDIALKNKTISEEKAKVIKQKLK